MKWKNKKCLTVLMALTVAVGVAAPGAVALSPTNVSAATISQVQEPTEIDSRQKAEEILALVNEARRKEGVAPLTMNNSLQTTADVRAKEIVTSFSHTRPNQQTCFTAGPDLNGENLAAGYPTVAAAFEGWMNSQGHRENILRPAFKTIGVSYYQDPNGYYGYYWVQMFSADETPGLLSVSSDGSVDASLSQVMSPVINGKQSRVSVPQSDAVNQRITVKNRTLWNLRQQHGVETLLVDIVDGNNNTLFTKSYSTANTNNDTAVNLLDRSSNVVIPPSAVNLDTSTVTMTSSLGTYTFLVKGNRDVANLQVSVANPNIASVSLQNANDPRGATYAVTAKAVGQTTVQVSYKGQTSFMTVNVQSIPSASNNAGSIMLDTAQYTMAPGNQYTIGAFIRDANGNQLTPVQVKALVDSKKLIVRDSRTGSVVSLAQLPSGHFQVTGKNEGTAYILYEIGGTHASVRIDVKKGATAKGSAVRHTSYFTRAI